ncbi:MAG: iron chelate uptake ABC transporter family permease subunit [Pseudomonadota bacterium]
MITLDVSARSVTVGAILAGLVLGAAMLSLATGPYPAPVLGTLLGQGDALEEMIIVDHRLPRILSAAGAGLAFGVAGAMIQSLLRNPLASPDVIGFGTGAAFCGLAALILTGGAILPGALSGGLVTAALVLALAWRGGLDPFRVVLIGIGANIALTAAIDLMISRLDILAAQDAARWLTGSLASRDWVDVALVAGGLALLLPVSLWLAFPLSRLSFDDDITRGLGLAISPLRLAVMVTGVALVAVAVCVAGPLPFVAFVAGPIARRLVGAGQPALIEAGLVGALIVVSADFVTRVMPGVHLPAGVFTGLIGAPALLWLLTVQLRAGKL